LTSGSARLAGDVFADAAFEAARQQAATNCREAERGMIDRRDMLKRGGLAAAGVLAGTRLAASPVLAHDGFYVPAETEPHERCFMQWPVSRAVYPDWMFLSAVQKAVIGF